MSVLRQIHRARRGAALLIVLAVLMITMTAATILVSRAADIRQQRRLTQCQLVADDVLTATDSPIQHWLEKESSKIVLPPEVLLPGSVVLHDRWNVSIPDEELEVELEIAGFDQHGMVPLQLARSGSPLRLTLPVDVLQRIDAVALPPTSNPTPLGLDLLLPSLSEGAGGDLEVFPAIDTGEARTFGDAPGPEPEGSATEMATLAIGGVVATHNRDPIRINVNTAPLPLVEAAMRLAGRGGLEQIKSARSKGASASVGEQVVNTPWGGRDSAQFIPQIVTTSDRWSFRIDIKVGPLRRSWWAVYGPGPDLPTTAHHESWMCIQRLPITE